MHSLIHRITLGSLLGLTACEPGLRTEQVAAPGSRPQVVANNSGDVYLDDVAAGLCCQLTSLHLYFNKYLVGHDEEGFASVFYQPYPDSAWVKIPQVSGRTVELDTANVDRQGGPELLLTIEYKRAGNPDYGLVRTLHILRTGATLDSLLATRIECADYHHAWENGEYYSIGQTQQVTAGYGFLRIGPIRTTCSRSRSTASCACDAADLVEAGGVSFARPGRYRWQHGRLTWISSR